MSNETNASTPTCTTCSTVYEVEHDAPFILLNPTDEWSLRWYTTPAAPLWFCGTLCLSSFTRRPENESRIAWLDPAQVNQAGAPNIERALSARGRVGCLYCDPVAARRGFWFAQERPGPFLRLQGYRVYGNTFCGGTKCLLAWCAEHPYNAKGYWERDGMRCVHCNDVYRDDANWDPPYGYLMVNDAEVVNMWDFFRLPGHAPPERARIFCSPACLLSHYEGGPEAASDLFWVALQEGSCCRCESSESTTYVAVGAPYGSIWDSLDGPSYFCSLDCFLKGFHEDAAECAGSGVGKWYRYLM